MGHEEFRIWPDEDFSGTRGSSAGWQREGWTDGYVTKKGDSPSLSALSAPMRDTIASASAAALLGSVSSTRCALRDQLSRFRADCDASCAKRSNKRIAAALKSCTTSSVGGECASGGGCTTSTRESRRASGALPASVVAPLLLDSVEDIWVMLAGRGG